MQVGVKKFGGEGKILAMKEVLNLAIKNDCFGELKHESLTEEMKRKALPLLIFMVLKINGEIKPRGVVNGSFQRKHADKADCTSQNKDFHSLKHVASVVAKEERDVEMVDLPGHFLQTEADDSEEFLIVKFTVAVTLLLVERYKDRWRKHLRRENGKWIVYAKCSKVMHGTLNTALMTHKKLAKVLK